MTHTPRSGRRSPGRGWRAAGLAAVLTGALAAALVWAHENHAPLPTKGVTIQGDLISLSPRGREAIGLTTARVALADLYRTVEVDAQVELPWHQQAMITSLVAGRVEAVLARPGQAVRQGQKLARIASLDLERLQADFVQAHHEAALARRRLDRLGEMEREGAVPGRSRLEAEMALAQKEARREVARQKLLALGLPANCVRRLPDSGPPVRHLAVTSPIDGVVTHFDLRAGQVIKATDHLAHVVNLDRLWVVGEVLEADAGVLAPGQGVTATFAAAPGTAFTGTIDHLRLGMNPHKRTQSLVMALDNRDGRLRPGMFGRASVRAHVAAQAVVCPTDALLEGRQGTSVLKTRGDERLVHQYVKVGLIDGPRAEILDGLFPGDQVVVTGNFLLASLLGREHKARVPDDPSGPVASSAGQSAPGGISGAGLVTAHATVEVPVGRQSFAGSRLEGKVRRVLTGPSQAVEPGQVLAEVESLHLRNTQLEFVEAAGRLRWIRDSLARLEPLRVQGAVPQAQIWQLQTDLLTQEQAVASLARALAHLGLGDEQVQALRQASLADGGRGLPLVEAVPVRALARGWVVDMNVVPGQVVHPEQSLFEIHDISRVWLRGHVFETDAPRLRVGQPARATFAAFPGLEASGEVVRVSPLLDAGTRVLPFWVEIDNPGRRLREGMLARVRVSVGPAAAPDQARAAVGPDGGSR